MNPKILSLETAPPSHRLVEKRIFVHSQELALELEFTLFNKLELQLSQGNNN